MSPAERALADQNPTFVDLCDRLREARRAEARARANLDWHDRGRKSLKQACAVAATAVSDADKAIAELISREAVE